MFKIRYLLVLTLLLAGKSYAQQCPIIPLPQQVNLGQGKFLLNSKTSIATNQKALKPIAVYLQNELLNKKHIKIDLLNFTKQRTIILQLTGEKSADTDSYHLKVSPKAITISASTQQGVFYGVISLLQLVRDDLSAKQAVSIPCWDIQDYARFQWRGFLLDESRHFFGKNKVKNILDWMAFYKLNRFHWHLTDEPAWRIEIKQYPLLALKGGVGNYVDPSAPAQYYTQDDIKEIVAYAKARFIEVIPEIDMPGHATAANKAYPEYSGGGSAKHPDYTFNPGKEETYEYLTNILKEVSTLFPLKMIHMGGDEVSIGNEKWKTDASIKALMAAKNLPDLKAVEQYFIKRMADSIIKMNAKILGWDEIAGFRLPVQNTIIFWWRHDHPEQLKLALDAGYAVVLCPRLPLYFDFVQDSLNVNGRKWGKKFNPLQSVYNFPSDTISQIQNRSKQILGIQANIWSETLTSDSRLDYMLFPRLSALAEAAWTNPERKNFESFRQRLKIQLVLYKQQGLYYYDPFIPQFHPEQAK